MLNIKGGKMNRRGSILKLSAIVIMFLLLITSAGYANIRILNAKASGNSTLGIWEDPFNDATKIDPNPPGSGMSDNYEVSGGKAKMINTYPAWTDSSWNKMKIISITNNAGQTLEGYALKLTINYDSDMQSDYDDLRFKHENDPDTYLGYWIESYTSSQALVWINIPSLPIGTSKVYMFYGNPNVTNESSFGDVFTDWDEQWSDDEKITNHAYNEGTWDPDVCYNGNSEFIVAWEEGQAYYPPYTYGFKQQIRASIYNTQGTKLVNDKLIFQDSYTYYRNENPSIAYGGGKYFVAWEHYEPKNLPPYNPSISTMDIYARTVQRSGDQLTLGSVKYICTESNCQADANVEFDSVNSRFLVVWEDARLGTSNYNIYGKLYDTDGNQVGSEKTITSATNSQSEPWVAFDPVNERYLIVWEDGETANAGPFDIYAGLFDENINIIGSPQKLADGDSDTDYNFPCVFFNSETNEYLVTWNDDDISDGVWRGNIWGRILDSSGGTVKNNFIISSGNYVRTDIVTYSISNTDDPYFVTYDGSDKIWGKFVTADGEPSTTEVKLSVSTDSDMKADWASTDIGSGKIFVAWEDTRVDYPEQFDFYPDVYGNLWNLETQTGLSVTYSIGSEKDKILLAHVTSIKIQKPTSDYWEEFNAVGSESGLMYSILDGNNGSILIADIDPGDSLIGVTASSLRIMATFTRSSPSYTPELDYWSISWIANNPPNTPSNPSPANGATGVGINVDLSWNCSDPDGDPLTYDVYFGTSSPPPLKSSGQTSNMYDPGPMNYGTIYYWKIVAFDNHGASTSGPIWSFTTWINHPPNTPSNPTPANGATNVDINADLSWNCSDPDGDPLTYDVYFDTNNPPVNKVSSGQSETTYDPGTLNFDTTYYWKIVAFDNQGGTTSGPVWSFTTEENEPPNTPSNPSPANGATNVDINADLSWDCEDPNGDELIYDIYFGTTSPPPIVYQDYPDTTYDPGTMLFDITYYWKIVAKDSYGGITEGPIWHFKTGSNDPPNTPSNPTPPDGSVDIPKDTTLCWDGGDPNPGDTVTYDLYFDTQTPPNIWKHDLTENCYDVTGMSYLKKYYWKIVAKDNNGATTEGPIWTFTTKKGDVNNPPGTPVIKGPVFIKPNKQYEYTVRSTDLEGEQIYYWINWGDNITYWTGPYNSGEEAIFSHSWPKPFKIYIITASARDENGNICDKDATFPVIVPKDKQTNNPILLRILEKLQEHQSIFLLFIKMILLIFKQ
jgi:hypothetical protein